MQQQYNVLVHVDKNIIQQTMEEIGLYPQHKEYFDSMVISMRNILVEVLTEELKRFIVVDIVEWDILKVNPLGIEVVGIKEEEEEDWSEQEAKKIRGIRKQIMDNWDNYYAAACQKYMHHLQQRVDDLEDTK